MATKAVVMVCWITMLTIVFMGCSMRVGGVAATAHDETYQEVLTMAGTNVLFGATNTYTIWARDIGIRYLFRFFFGLGGTRDAVVRTDTIVTLGRNGDASKIYACKNGKLELVAVDPSCIPENAIVRVRYNSTDGNYRLQITEASPAVYVQFTYLSLGGLLCTSGVAGSPIRFQASSSSSSNHLDEPTIVLREAVNAA